MPFTWPLTIPPYAAPSVAPASSYLSPAPGISASIPFFYPASFFLQLVESLLPRWYLEPLITVGPGYELLQAMAEMFSRVSLSVGRVECSMFNLFASGGVLGRGAVQFYRASDTAGAFTVKRGTVVTASKSNRAYTLVADIEFSATDLIVNGIVEAVTPAGEYNVPGPVTTADSTLLPGEIDTVTLPFLEPFYAEPTIQVRQIGPVTGGQAPALDQLGEDRRVARNPNESDDIYRDRIRKLPDTVSPRALARQLDSIFLPMGLSYDLIETWDNRYQSCWDAPLGPITSPTMGTALEGTWCWSDPRTDGFYGRWMGDEDHRGALVVVVPNLQFWKDRGMVYDDPVDDVADFSSALGRRAHSAYDSPTLDTTEILSGVMDGTDSSRATFYKNLYDLLTQVKGGGVRVSVELDPAVG